MEISVKTDILSKNDQIARELKAEFEKNKIFVFNLMGSPGSGKTTLLEATLRELAQDYNILVIEGDLYTQKDADRINALGVKVIQINTVGGCHLDAQMIKNCLEDIDLSTIDLIIIENVGNLVCPAEFDIGEAVKATVLSITEGEDKPLKYPLIFKESKVILLNKIDLLPYVPFNKEKALEDLTNLNPVAPILEISALNKDGLEKWVDWIKNQIKSLRA